MRYKLLLAAASALWFSPAPASAQMHSAIPLSAAEFARSVPGQSIQLVVRIQSRQRANVRAQLLERVNETIYRSTQHTVDLYVNADTPVVMGTASEISPGAVIFVYGVATSANHADVKKAVVMTKYVTVK